LLGTPCCVPSSNPPSIAGFFCSFCRSPSTNLELLLQFADSVALKMMNYMLQDERLVFLYKLVDGVTPSSFGEKFICILFWFRFFDKTSLSLCTWSSFIFLP
jgi:hypothetical protein